MKKMILSIGALCIGLGGCSKPVAVEIGDVCSQAAGSSVIVKGYVSLPPQIDTVQLTRGGKVVAVGLQLYMMTKADATGDAVKTTFWTSDKGEPNKVKPLPRGYTWNDLLLYTDDGKAVGAGKQVSVTGEVKTSDAGACVINSSRIEAL